MSRTEGNTAPTGKLAGGFIDQSWTITGGGGLAMFNASLVLQYDTTALGGLTEGQIDGAWKDASGTVTLFPVTLDTLKHMATITGVTGFSTWFLGNQATAPVARSAFELE